MGPADVTIEMCELKQAQLMVDECIHGMFEMTALFAIPPCFNRICDDLTCESGSGSVETGYSLSMERAFG